MVSVATAPAPAARAAPVTFTNVPITPPAAPIKREAKDFPPLAPLSPRALAIPEAIPLVVGMICT